jgi:hypothetical protein
MVMIAVAMPERIGTHPQGQQDHADLKTQVMYDIDAKKRKAGQE